MAGPITRILLRVLAGFFIARGMPQDLVDLTSDPKLAMDVEVFVGVACWTVAEGFYAAARRLGWST